MTARVWQVLTALIWTVLIVNADHLGVLLDGDEGPDSEPDGPLPVDVEVFDRLSEASVTVKILKSTLKS